MVDIYKHFFFLCLMFSPIVTSLFVLGYFSLLIFISKKASKNSNDDAFFIGERKSPWYVVSFGMIGATLSGITFLSVPGWVEKNQFFYLQMVLGYVPGYLFVAYILMPIYYRMNIYSIYEYLRLRFGNFAHKSGAIYFLISRLLGASLRLYLVVLVLQTILFDLVGFPFFITSLITIVLIFFYTYKSGIKTIVWTDTLQTSLMLITLVMCTLIIFRDLGYDSIRQSISMNNLELNIFLFSNFENSSNFFRSFISGMFVAIAMTGLDQDMMQKNLSCKNLKEAQKNMVWFSILLVFVNIVFLYLGSLLYQYAFVNGIDSSGDKLFVDVVKFGKLGKITMIFFLFGLMSAAFSSADSALTSLTTCICIDFLNFNKKNKRTKFSRNYIHVTVSILLFLIIIAVNYFNNDNIISTLFKVASYTYGPLIGLFLFGLISTRIVNDNYIPIIVMLSPLFSYLISKYDKLLFSGFDFGPDLLIVNGIFTFLMLYCCSSKKLIN